MSELDENSLERRIASLIVNGWRKGVDSKKSAIIFNLLNSAFFNSDDRISGAANEHCLNIGVAVAPLIRNKASEEEIAQAIKEAAIKFIPKQPGEFELTVDNQGVEMLRKLMPIEFNSYGKRRLANVQSEYYAEDDEDNTFTMREQIWMKTEQKWESRKYLSEESSLTHIGAVLIKLAQEIPEVMEYFADVMRDNEEDFRIQLHKIAQLISDDDWKSMAYWITFCLKK